MTQDTKLQQLVINKLTTAQYQAALNAGTIDPNQLYMTTDSQTLKDVTVGGSSIVSNNTVALGTMALETASNYSTKAVADTLYAQKALETTVAGKLDKISTASKVYGTDVNGNQTSYDITSFGNVDDVKVGTTSVVANKIATLGTMAGQPTTNYYTKSEIDGKLSAGMHYKGTVASYSDLPTTGNQTGDLYNVTDTGSNYAWDGTTWDKMSENIDLSNVVPNTRTINGKELSTNITLSASDVNALPSSTVIPTVDQTYSSSSTSTNALSHKAIANAKFIQNTGSTYSSVAIVGTSNIESSAVVIGYGASAGQSGVYNGNNEIAIGYNATARNGDGIAIGYNAKTTAGNAIQLGRGTNSTANTMQVWNYTLLDENGFIPDDRLNTTIARTSSLPSIATTLVAGLVKPDGTSITVDANGVISSAAGVEIDNETITKNGDNELQTVAIINPNTNSGAISPLKIWNGSEYQWNHGEATVWNYWQTDVQAMWSNGGQMPADVSWHNLAYGNNRFVTAAFSSYRTAYSTDGGVTWTAGGNLPTSSTWSTLLYINNKFIIISRHGKTAYSTDDGITWTAGGDLPTGSTSWNSMAYGEGRLVAIDYDSNTRQSAYSTDDGITWTSGGNLPTGSYVSLAYGEDVFVAVTQSTNNKTAYSTDGGITWTSGGNLPISSDWVVQYGNGRFVAISQSGKSAYSTDGGVTWTAGGNLPTSGSSPKIKFGGNMFVCVFFSNSTSAYSTDGGVTWIQSNMITSNGWQGLAYGNDKFITVPQYKVNCNILSYQMAKCYTLDSTPTTLSQVYSEPEIVSTKTITSVGSGTITLSNNLVYNSTPAGNQNTYRTLGDAHPDWLCNINNVGVKIGNTTIATASGGSGIEEITDSEIEELWGE